MQPDLPMADSLMQPLQFTEADLIANRQGQLGDTQRQRLQSLQIRALIIGVMGFFGFALVATVFLFFGSENSLLIMTLIGVFITICNAIFVGMFARQYMRLRADLTSGEIDILEGQLERVVIPNGRMNNFLLRIEGVEFYVKKDLFKLFRHDVHYRFYRTIHSHVLLSAEPNP